MSSTTTKRCTRFFKVFLPEYCSERMRIPDAFVSQLDRSVPKKAILRNGNRKIWHVKVGKISDGVFFLNGWQEFVKDNLIELGDFLVFQYNGHDVFGFKIFGNSGCEKEEIETHVSINNRIEYLKEEEEEEAEETEEEENDSDNDDDEDYEDEVRNKKKKEKIIRKKRPWTKYCDRGQKKIVWKISRGLGKLVL